MSGQNDFAAPIGRILLALFRAVGVLAITGFADGRLHRIARRALPMAAAIKILIEFGCGLHSSDGRRAGRARIHRLLIVITPIFHNFWSALEAEKMMQQISSMKNMGIWRVLSAAPRGRDDSASPARTGLLAARESSQMVTGPSLTSATCISAPNTPVLACRLGCERATNASKPGRALRPRGRRIGWPVALASTHRANWETARIAPPHSSTSGSSPASSSKMRRWMILCASSRDRRHPFRQAGEHQ
jgi:hypothetical protein